jgi:tetratricopeptide (TPR) repeat protein
MSSKTIPNYLSKEIANMPKTPAKQAEIFRDVALRLIEDGEDALAVDFWRQICANILDEYLAYLAYGCLAGSLYFQQNYTEACKALEQAKKLNPDDSNVYDQLGLDYALSGKFDKALENIEKGLKIDSSNFSLASSHYIVYALMNDYDKARDALKNDLKNGKIPVNEFCKDHDDFLHSKVCEEWEKKILVRMLEDICSTQI